MKNFVENGKVKRNKAETKKHDRDLPPKQKVKRCHQLRRKPAQHWFVWILHVKDQNWLFLSVCCRVLSFTWEFCFYLFFNFPFKMASEKKKTSVRSKSSFSSMSDGDLIQRKFDLENEINNPRSNSSIDVLLDTLVALVYETEDLRKKDNFHLFFSKCSLTIVFDDKKKLLFTRNSFSFVDRRWNSKKTNKSRWFPTNSNYRTRRFRNRSFSSTKTEPITFRYENFEQIRNGKNSEEKFQSTNFISHFQLAETIR